MQNDAKRTKTNNFARAEDRGISTEEQQESKAMDDEFYFKRTPTNYGYKDMKKDLFA